MMTKSPKTRKPITVVNPVLFDHNEADYLVSQEREQSGLEITFEQFLKRRRATPGSSSVVVDADNKLQLEAQNNTI